MQAICKICKHESAFLFEATVLQKELVKYYKCQNCGFIQTEEPYWLNEAYNSPIGSIDVGLLQRNISLSEQVSKLLESIHTKNSIYLDYGGGYGIFVRLMRDKGFNFYLSDLYAENLFAKYFELKDAKINTGFCCLTAFEVFEHLVDPLTEIEKMFTFSDTIIFSTELQPKDRISDINDWWYFVPEGGQHVSLYSLNSLIQLQEYFSCQLYTNRYNLHILTKTDLVDPFKKLIIKKPSNFVKIKNRFFKKRDQNEIQVMRESLLMKDFEFYKEKLSNDKN
ncbi:MAG: class I SAM-dependent methyltransferase [Bacteroidetes bacterium]|nr:class I SAM-dependent methyltransferase [Bacteroidota bacterium]